MRSRNGPRHFLFSHFSKLLSLFLLVSLHQLYVQADQLGEKVIVDPFSLLAGIDKANRSLSFRGLLTYEANGYISTMRLVQTVVDQTVSQRLKFLDGPKRQVIRQKVLSDCNENIPKWQLWPRNFDLDKSMTLPLMVLKGLLIERPTLSVLQPMMIAVIVIALVLIVRPVCC
jgi:MucB/RseB N-terminal domain